MDINPKLKENLIRSIGSSIGRESTRQQTQYRLSPTRSDISSAIDTATKETWDSMNLAERCGPPLWDFLLWMAAVADNENKPDLYLRALELVEEGHPCKDVCRPHIRDNLEIVRVEDYDSSVDHCIDFHNLVNEQLGKPQYPEERAKEKVNLGCDSCTFSPTEKSSFSRENNVSTEYKRSNSGAKTTIPGTARDIRTKTVNDNDGKRSTADSTIYYPSQFRIRDTNFSRVYAPNRTYTGRN